MTNLKILAIMLVALIAWPVGATSADSTVDLLRLNGRWKLDWDRSESFDPVMDLLEVPWLVQRLSGIVPVYATFEVEAPACESCAPSLRIFQENPIKNTTRVVVLDGKPGPFVDPLGNESIDRFTWSSDSGLEMIRERVLKSGKKARILDRRSVEDDLASMISTMTVWIDGEERASIRRVLVKVNDLEAK